MWYDEAVVYQIYPLGLCGAPLQNDEVWLKRGNTGYFTRAACPYCGHWYLRFKSEPPRRPALELCPLHRPGYPGVRCQMG